MLSLTFKYKVNKFIIPTLLSKIILTSVMNASGFIIIKPTLEYNMCTSVIPYFFVHYAQYPQKILVCLPQC